MSLINDALKKAQKQRTGEAPPLASLPSVGGESPQRIARRAKPAGFDTMMVRAGIGAAVVLVLAVGGFFLLRDKTPDGGPQSRGTAGAETGPPPAPSSSSAGGPVSAPAVANPGPAASTPPVAAPTFTLPVASKADDRGQTTEVSPATVGGASRPDNPPVTVAKTEPPKQSPPATQPKASGTQPSSPAAKRPDEPAKALATAGSPSPPPKLEPRAIEFIENLKVAGIRASPTDAKVLMNDRVYRLGSQVSAEFGLKLVEIANGSLTFEDDKGGRYTRTF